MKGIFRNIVSVVLALVIMVTTSGFTVFEHYCNSEKTTEYALIIPEFDCDHTGHDHDEELPPCCSGVHEMSGESCKTGDCCDTDTHMVKLNITHDLQDMNKKMAPDLILFNSELSVIKVSTEPEISNTIIRNDLPPPKSGKDLHIFLNQLNIPYPSV